MKNIIQTIVQRFHESNQSRAAEHLGIQVNTLNHYFHGRRQIKAPLLLKLRKLYCKPYKSNGFTDSELLDLLNP